MRALAEFVMRGRTQAMLVTVISAGTVMFYWVGAAVLALVTLRHGIKEGFLLLLWSSLPASAVAWYGGEIAPLVVLASCWLAATVLRQLVSWPLALIAAAACSMAVSGLVYSLQPEWLLLVHKAFIAALESFSSQLPPDAKMPVVEVVTVAGAMGLFQVVVAVLCLILGRYWQASLFNPGGLRKELYAVRFPPRLAIAVLVVAMLCASGGPAMLPWAYLAAVPLLVAGLCLVHAVVASKNMGGLALAFVYGLLLLVNPVKDVIILAAFLDSWLNFRRRLPGQQQD